MTLVQHIEQDLTTALKSRDELTVSTLRQLKTALSNAEIAQNRTELTEQDGIRVLQSEAKRRIETAEVYRSGGRSELADKELAEAAIIKKYLPAQVDDVTIRQWVAEAIAVVPTKDMAAMGGIIKVVMQRAAGAADGAVVSRIVKEALTSQ